MKIGVLGAGKVARAIAGHWIRRGHDVVFGVRNPAAHAAPDGARIATIGDAAIHGDVILLAIPASAMESTVLAIAEVTAGKILLDCSNGLSPVDHHLALPDLSGAEEIALWAPESRVVKIFNTAGFETLIDPLFDGEAATMFYATDEESAQAIAHSLAAECGFDPVYAGTLAVARDLESLTRFWGKLAFGQRLGREIAFKLLRKGMSGE